jgi:hypothetical protein
MQPLAYGYKPELGPIPQLSSEPKLNRSTLLSSTREPNMQAVINLMLTLSSGSALIADYCFFSFFHAIANSAAVRGQ